MRFLARTAPLLLSGAVLLSACGGQSVVTPSPSPTPTMEPIAAGLEQTNAVCAEYQIQLDATAMPGNPAKAQAADLSAWSKWLDTQLTLLQQELTALQAAPQPSPTPSVGGPTFMSTFQALVQDYQAADTAAKAGDPATFKQQMAALETETQIFQGLAKALGLPGCAA